jgi:membrane associated rhomboid family serine protease
VSESKALVLLFLGAFALGGIAGVVLALTDASGTAYGLSIFVGAALGGYISSLVLMHYGKLEERRKREEILLSR